MLLPLVSHGVLSFPLCPGLFCTVFKWKIPYCTIYYCCVGIRSVPSCSDQIHHFPSRSVSKLSYGYQFSSFLYQYHLLTPIMFYSVLSHCNPLCSKFSQLNSSSPFMLHIKTCTFISIQFLSVISHPNIIPWLPSRFIAYFRITIYSVPLCPDWNHYPVMFHIKTFMLWSIRPLSVYLCTKIIHLLP